MTDILCFTLCLSLLILSSVLIICIAFYQGELYRITESMSPFFKEKRDGTMVKVFNDPLPWWKEIIDHFSLCSPNWIPLHSQNGFSQKLVRLSRNAASALGAATFGVILVLRTV